LLVCVLLFGRQGACAIDVNMGTNCLQKYSFSAHCVDKMKTHVFENAEFESFAKFIQKV
jgi:hypothetical protein